MMRCRVIYCTRDLEHHRPGIKPFVHAHDGDARLDVSRHDGPLDRSSTTPARQQRGMDIEAAFQRGFENGLRQQQSIGHNHRRIGLEGSEPVLLLWRFQRQRRAHFDASGHGEGMTGVGLSAMPRPAGRGGWA